ncbi:hypothetical protein LTR84_005108 [Exophiala bonariae]|uniref:C2H2-type domain-containing protein n=1 Tax=Exophiala bonariae TaxID=1690606 RepID=A0AAV9NRD9_9EURO|nr:hypothetical protein LTR84_005108 [Exophiala bonariae]
MALVGVSTIEFAKSDTLKASTDNAKRKHVCSVCSRAFKRSEHCVRHQRRRKTGSFFFTLLIQRGPFLEDGKEDSGSKDETVSTKTSSNKAGSLRVKPQSPLQASTATVKRKKPAPVKPGKRPRLSSLDISTAHQVDGQAAEPPLPTPDTTDHQHSPQVPLGILENEVGKNTSLANSPPALTPFNADMGLLEFFDPFFGLPAEQIVDMSLPGLKGLTEGFSPLEQFSSSSADSQLGHRDSENYVPSQVSATEPASMSIALQQGEDRPAQASNDLKDFFRTDPADFFLNSCTNTPVPKVRRVATAKPPTLAFTDSMRTKLLQDLSKRLPPEKLSDFKLPPAVALQKCFRTFVDAFHVHMPIFHLPTLNLEQSPSPLVLAICSIGALYRLERKVAAALYHKADQALAQRNRGVSIVDRTPNLLEDWTRPGSQQTSRLRDTLWTGQARLLLTMFASFSGDPEVMSRAIAQIGEFSLDFRRLAPSVKPRNFGMDGVTWQDWVDRECVKRLLYGHIMLTNSLAMTYGMPPSYSIVSDGNIEMPGDQSLWDATNASQWYDLVNVKGRSSLLSVRDAVSTIMYGSLLRGVPEECWSWSPFACTVVINAVSIQIWHVTQGSYFFDELTSIGQGQSHGPEDSQVLTQTEAALSRCLSLITQARSGDDYTWTEAEGPLLFNCLALLRVTYCRAFTGNGHADRMMLLKDNREDIITSLEEFVAVPQERDEFTSRAVARAFEGMVIPSKAGTLLLRKTAALSWSIEHALAGWDAALLVTKWVHMIEVETIRGRSRVLSEREEQLIQNMGDILAEDDGIDQATSMAARLAEHWASFYDDTWVWGVTPRIGWILRELSNCYENALLSI